MSEKKLIKHLESHLHALSERLELDPDADPVHAYVAGGVAVNYWTGHRMSDDVDLKWSHRVPIPPDMQTFEVPDKSAPIGWRLVTIDGGFADSMGSFPPDWEQEAGEIARVGRFALHVISPLDLAVSKIARFQDNDREDIRQLAAHGLLDPERFEKRAMEALDYYIGNTNFVMINLRDALKIVRKELDDPHP